MTTSIIMKKGIDMQGKASLIAELAKKNVRKRAADAEFKPCCCDIPCVPQR